jgi:hypothetical protein
MTIVKAAAVQINPVLYSREGTVQRVVQKILELGSAPARGHCSVPGRCSGRAPPQVMRSPYSLRPSFNHDCLCPQREAESTPRGQASSELNPPLEHQA